MLDFITKIKKSISTPWGVNILYIIWIVIVLVIGYGCKIFDKKMFRFGPPELGEKEIVFFGNKITTWTMILIIMTYAFINQFISTYHGNIYSPWITNTIQDPKVKDIQMEKSKLFTMINLENMFGWVNYFIGINVLFTMEFQFILPRMIASIIAYNLGTIQHLKNKKDQDIKED